MDNYPDNLDSLLAELTTLRRRVAELEARHPAEPADQKRLPEPEIYLQAQLLEAVSQAVIAIDLDDRIIYWNRFAEELFRWSKAEAEGRRITEVLSTSEMHRQVTENIAKLERGQRWTGEFHIRRRDGSSFWVEVTGSPLYNEAGKLAGMAQVSMDVSARKLAEESLRESEQHFQTLVDALPQFVAYTDRNQRYRFVNKTYRQAFGQETDEIIGRSLPEVIGQTAYEQARPYVEKALSGQYVRYHEWLTYADGTRRPIEGHLVPHVTDEGQVLGYYAILTDTSPYKKTQQSLQEAEALFRQLAENIQEVFWVRELPGRRLIYVNPAYEKIWGRS